MMECSTLEIIGPRNNLQYFQGSRARVCEVESGITVDVVDESAASCVVMARNKALHTTTEIK